MAIAIGSDPVEDYGRAMQAGSTDGIDPSVVMAKYGDPGNLASAYAEATGTDRQTAFNKLMAALTGSNPAYRPDQKTKKPGAYDRLTQQAAKNLGVGSGLTDFTDPDAVASAGLQGLQQSYDSPYAPKPGQPVGSTNFPVKRNAQPFPFQPIAGGRGYADGGYVDDGGNGQGNNPGYDATGLGLDPLSSFLIGAGASGLASGALNVGQAVGAGVQGGMRMAQQNAALGLQNRKLKLAEQYAPIQRELGQAQADELKARAPLYAAQAKAAEFTLDRKKAMMQAFGPLLYGTAQGASQTAAASGGQFDPHAPALSLPNGATFSAADVKAATPQGGGKFAAKTVDYDPDSGSVVDPSSKQPLFSIPQMWRVGLAMSTSGDPDWAKAGNSILDQIKQIHQTGMMFGADGSMFRIRGWDQAQFNTKFAEGQGMFQGERAPAIRLEKGLEAQNARERIGLETQAGILRADNEAKNRFTTIRGPDGREQIVPEFYARGMYEQNLQNANQPPPQQQPAAPGAFNVGGGGGTYAAAPSATQISAPASPPQQSQPQQPPQRPGQVNFPPGLEKGLAPDETAVVEHFAKNTLPALASMRNNAEKGQGEIRSMQGVLDQISTGPLEKHILPLQQSVANLFGLFGQKPPADFAATIANKELFAKDGTRLGFELAKTLGSREAQMIVQQAISANPNLLNSQEGNKRLLSLFYQAYQRDIDRGKFAGEYYKDNRAGGGATLNEAAFEEAFNKAHPMKAYIGKAVGLPEDQVAKLPKGTRFIGKDGDIYER